MGDANPIRTLGDYSKPSHEGYRNTIELPVGNNVVPFRFDTTRLVQKGCSFHGLRFEDPNQHLKDFLKLMDSLDLDGENKERTRLRRTAKLRNDILMFQQHHGESLSEAWTLQIFYDHVNPVTRRTIDQSVGGKLHDKNAEESWTLLEDLTLYDNESWNDPRDFTNPIKAVSLPQDVPSTSDRRLIKIENQICNGPHDTQYCMKNPEQAFVDYASSRTDRMRSRQFAMNQGPRNFNEANNNWKGNLNINWARAQTFTSPRNGSFSIYLSSYQTKLEKVLIDFESHQEKRLCSLRTQLGQQQDDMISKINLLCKAVFEKLDDTPIRDTTGDLAAQMNFTSTNDPTREEL
ncbi:hypothetical protein Tco_1125011 [Tanacetum coccineum]|uniref:MAK10-like protein n=1 Tax=Tanacetum coccineum TaxID=301880 RepID=A0ABQ5J8E3_9ASTR